MFKEISCFICKNCKEEKEHYAKNMCESCYGRKYVKIWIKNNPKKWKKIVQKSNEKWKHNNPEKRKTHQKTNKAIRKGIIPKPILYGCIKCGKQAQEYHHSDYSKPLLVIPLCSICHKHIHKKIVWNEKMNLKNLKVIITYEALKLLTKYVEETMINKNQAIDTFIKEQLG